VKFWLLTLTRNQVLRLAVLKTSLKKKKKKNSSSSSKPLQKMNNRLQQEAEDFKPWDRLKRGTQIFILLSVKQKVR